MPDTDRYYLCLGNPKGPLLKLSMEWEAKEMIKNLEYVEVDADGLPVVVAEEELAVEA